MPAVSDQLEMFGLEGAKRLTENASTSARERSRLLRGIDVTHELMSELPSGEDLSFLHSGLCQSCLPHSRPAENHALWYRKSGRFSLTVQPGSFDGSYVGIWDHRGRLQMDQDQPGDRITEVRWLFSLRCG